MGLSARSGPETVPAPHDGAAIAEQTRAYGSGARLLSIGIAATGLLTFAYFAISSHVLGEVPTKRLDVLWSVMFVIISVIYRPIEQLLSRTIAQRRARGREQERLRVPIAIQASFAVTFLVAALALRGEFVHKVFDGYAALYWILVVGTLAYAASYFARGWLAGHKYFGLYGGLVLMESVSRVCFVLAAVAGIASGQTAVALGIAAAPLVSLVVVPAAFARSRGERRASSGRAPDATARQPELPAGPITVDEADAGLAGPGTEAVQEAVVHDELSLRHGAGFAFSVAAIMLCEQTLLNGAVLTVDATSSELALAGIVFNVMLIARAPLQLFQAIQTSLLPHLAGLEATAGRAAFGRAIASRCVGWRCRGARGGGAADDRPDRDGAPVRAAPRVRARRAGGDRRGDGPPPDLRSARPGGPRAATGRGPRLPAGWPRPDCSSSGWWSRSWANSCCEPTRLRRRDLRAGARVGPPLPPQRAHRRSESLDGLRDLPLGLAGVGGQTQRASTASAISR